MVDPHPVCTRFHLAVELIGARWAGAILRAIFTDQRRFAEIRSAIPGVSDSMLTQRLRELEKAGILERVVLTGPPVGVEYHLTQMGAELAPTLDSLIAWSHRWIPLPNSAATAESSATTTESSAATVESPAAQSVKA